MIVRAVALAMLAGAVALIQPNARELPAVAELVNARLDTVTYRGARALRLVPPDSAGRDDMLALLEGPEFKNGTIEIEVAREPAARGTTQLPEYIGVSFRTGPRGAWSDIFYLRPTNGRADEQLRRNHAVRCASDPAHPWHRLREESPGVYESYADMEAGAWTRMRIEVAGTRARLYVNGASQPCLIVSDIKHGERPGRIALWAHVTTDAYFGGIEVVRRSGG